MRELPPDNAQFPSAAGAGTRLPDRSPSQVCQSSHQDPERSSARASHCSGSEGYSVPVKYFALGLPGGFSMLWICPAVAQDKERLASQELCGRIAPLPRGDVIGDASRDEGIHHHFERSIGVPSIFNAPRLTQGIFEPEGRAGRYGTWPVAGSCRCSSREYRRRPDHCRSGSC